MESESAIHVACVTWKDRLAWFDAWAQRTVGALLLKERWEAFKATNVYTHARREMCLVLHEMARDSEDDGRNWEYQLDMYAHILRLLEVFSDEGHSGMSASFAREIFATLADFKPLTPLTGADWEWGTEASPDQNLRCSRVFRDAQGARDIQGKVFVEPGGMTYTSGESAVPVEFPYTPKTEFVPVESTR